MKIASILSQVSRAQPTFLMPTSAYFASNPTTHIKTSCIVAIVTILGGCTSPSQFSASPDPAHVQSTVTPYTSLAQCVGKTMAITHPEQAVEIAVGNISDETAPHNALNKSLSNGAGVWIRSLAAQMGKQVKVLVSKNGALTPDTGEANMLVINGAWTQNDRVADSSATRFKLKFGDLEFGYGADDSYNIVAGDFLWYRYGANHIQGAISVLVFIKTATSEGDVFVNSDGKGIATTMRFQSVQGVHLSQRTALEFALAKIIADATGVNMQLCVHQPHTAPEFAKEQDTAFRNMRPFQQYVATQSLLIKLGYLPKKESDTLGQWNTESRQALQEFLVDRGLPPASNPHAQHYVMLQLAAHEKAI